MKIQPYLAALIVITAGCSTPSNSPLEIATAFQLAIENENYKDAYNFIDDSLKEQTIPEDIELFFNSESSVLTKPTKGFLLPVVASYPTYRIVEFEETNPSDSCGITDIVVVRNRNDVWSVVWADHLSSEITLATDIHPLSTRNRFYSNYYSGVDLSEKLPYEWNVLQCTRDNSVSGNFESPDIFRNCKTASLV
jgi:hypothetical protein